MADLGLAIVSLTPLAKALLFVIRDIIEIKDIVRRAKEELENLESRMTRLSSQLEELVREADGQNAIRFPEADHMHIKRVLEDCKVFLTHNRDSLLSKGMKGAMARLTWSLSHGKIEELQGYGRKVNETYIDIIEPFWRRYYTPRGLWPF